MNHDKFLEILDRRGIRLEPATLERVQHGPITRLLTTGNPKTAKGEAAGYFTAILHLAPALQSGLQMCPKATAGCAAACLNTAGRGGIDAKIPAARNRKTYWYVTRRREFMARLVREIENHITRAESHGLVPCVRLNGTSDIRWENVQCERNGTTFRSVMDAFSDVQFYDYTKLPDRRIPMANYHLTFSAADGNDLDVSRALHSGMSVAVVFRSRAILESTDNMKAAGIRMRAMSLPATWNRRPVVDGDRSDLRFLDPPRAIVALRAKGSAVADESGFVRDLP